MNKKEPFELQYFKFLPQNTKKKVEGFVSKLEEPQRDFAYKRYFENKTIRVIAEEMGYEERTLYKYRNEIIDLWDRFYDDQFSHHRERVLAALKRHGKLEYGKLLMNMNLKRSGLDLEEFKDILKLLVASGEVVCFSYESESPGKQKKVYALSRFVNNLSNDSNIKVLDNKELVDIISG